MDNDNCKACPQCAKGQLHPGVRDVTVVRNTLSTTIKSIAGAFCDHCGEIEFDEATDSAQRYAQAGDQLVLQNRAARVTHWAPVESEHPTDIQPTNASKRRLRKQHDPVAVAMKHASIVNATAALNAAAKNGTLKIIHVPQRARRKLKQSA